MTSLIEFLTARIDEDERKAKAACCEFIGEPWSAFEDTIECVHPRNRATVAEFVSIGAGDHIARHDPERVLREVEAKRRIVGWWAEAVDWNKAGRIWYEQGQEWCNLPTLPPVLRALAMVYEDHPDYRAMWNLV